MSLFVRIDVGFWSHRKTLRLRALLGDAALWIPPRLWSYAAQNQPDGDFTAYLPAEIGFLLGYSGDSQAMLQALQQAGFMDGAKIHGWADHNGFHEKFAARAKKAAKARWDKRGEGEEKTREEKRREDKRGEEASNAVSIDKQCLKHINSVNLADSGDAKTTDSPKISSTNEERKNDAKNLILFLNEKAGKRFGTRPTYIKQIQARLSEPDVTPDGCKTMILRQIAKWIGTEYEEYLTPETLFRPTKFPGYYDSRDLPLPSNGKSTPPKSKTVGLRAGEEPPTFIP